MGMHQSFRQTGYLDMENLLASLLQGFTRRSEGMRVDRSCQPQRMVGQTEWDDRGVGQVMIQLALHEAGVHAAIVHQVLHVDLADHQLLLHRETLRLLQDHTIFGDDAIAGED